MIEVKGLKKKSGAVKIYYITRNDTKEYICLCDIRVVNKQRQKDPPHTIPASSATDKSYIVIIMRKVYD